MNTSTFKIKFLPLVFAFTCYVGDATFACETCTYANSGQYLDCEMCGTALNLPEGHSVAADTDTVDNAEPTNACPSCTYSNAAGARECEMCLTDLPNAAPGQMIMEEEEEPVSDEVVVIVQAERDGSMNAGYDVAHSREGGPTIIGNTDGQISGPRTGPTKDGGEYVSYAEQGMRDRMRIMAVERDGVMYPEDMSGITSETYLDAVGGNDTAHTQWKLHLAAPDGRAMAESLGLPSNMGMFIAPSSDAAPGFRRLVMTLNGSSGGSGGVSVRVAIESRGALPEGMEAFALPEGMEAFVMGEGEKPREVPDHLKLTPENGFVTANDALGPDDPSIGTPCGICLEDFEVGHVTHTVLCTGNHVFHAACQKKWPDRCATCRFEAPAETAAAAPDNAIPAGNPHLFAGTIFADLEGPGERQASPEQSIEEPAETAAAAMPPAPDAESNGD